MKVCHLITYSSDSHYIINLGKGLADKGISVCYGTLFNTGIEKPEWMSKEIDYFCLNVASKKDFIPAAWKLRNYLRENKIDILQTHLYEASFVGMLAAKLAGTKVKILTRHYLDQNHQIGNKLALFLDRWEAKTADEIIVLSNAVKEFMSDVEKVDADKITVIHQGFDFDIFSASDEDGKKVRQEFGISEDDFVIGTIGNFTSTKGHSFMVSAAKELIEEMPNLKLMFIGDGGDKKTVQEQIAEENLQERVIFTGFRGDVNACMKAVDVVVHPSLSEAFCQVLIETMSVGTPIVSTDVGGAKEVITDGKNGFIIPPANVEAIKKAVRNLFQNPEATKKMALAGQQSVRETFTVEKMIDKQIAVYERLFKEK